MDKEKSYFFKKKISLFREMFAGDKKKQGFIEKAFVINHMRDDCGLE